MFKRANSPCQILRTGRIAILRKRRSLGKSGDRHATAFAECCLVVGALDSARTAERTDFTRCRRTSPPIKNGHVEIAFSTQHAKQKVRTVNGFCHRVRLCHRRHRRKESRNVFRRKRKSPNRKRNLLRIQIVRIGKVRKIFAHVTARIIPTALYIALFRGTINADRSIQIENIRRIGTVFIKIVEDRGKRICCKCIFGNCKSSRNGTVCKLNRIGSRFERGSEIDRVKASTRKPAIGIRTYRKRSCRNRNTVFQKRKSGPRKIGRIFDNDRHRFAHIITDLIVVKSRCSICSCHKPKRG